MKKLIITSDDQNRQFAFVKGNRPTNAKTVKAKEKSMQEHGQLSPITVVKGEDVYLMNGHLVDLQGKRHPPTSRQNSTMPWWDGHTEWVAWMKLGARTWMTS